MPKNKIYTVEEATRLLEKYCVYQDRCHAEVERKLDSLTILFDAKETIIIHLIQNDFLNETRFAQNFARGKFTQKKWGKVKIKNALQQRKISSYNIDIALKEISQEDYTHTIEQLIVKKVNSLPNESTTLKKKKVLDFLLQKGYAFNEVIDRLNKLFP